MNLVITNRLTIPVSVASADEGGWAAVASPGQPLNVSRPGTDDLIIGDKPDVTGQIIEGLGTAFEAIKAIVTFHKPKPTPQGEETTLSMNCVIGNNGPASVRVILGDGQTDAEVAPGAQYEAQCPRYIEIRELGHAPQQGGTPK